MQLASSLDEAQQLDVYVADTSSKGFKDMLKKRRKRSDKFFHHQPPKVLDICQVPIPSRLEKTSVVNRTD